MKIGVIGTGRMGKILATRISADHEIVLYDADYANAKKIAESLRLAVVSLIDEMKVDVVLLAVPDNAVRSCIEKLHETGKNWTVFNVATNISREMLADMANEKVVCINTKIIGHAGEMSRGAKPVIIVDKGNPELVQIARQVFSSVGSVLEDNADIVQQVNRIATEAALKAAVSIERSLHASGITDAEILRGALSQVASGVLQAYAANDLGPFARKIVDSLNDKSGQ